MVPDRSKSVLVIVDVQNDFCAGGTLAVPGGDQVVEPINRISPLFDRVVLTQDWHPRGHVSFASSWPGKALHESVETGGLVQLLWPDHCVAGSRGADFHPLLSTDHATLVLRKGTRRELDSYSGLFENDRRTSTGLEGWLRACGVASVYLCGLAADYCVLYTGIDALEAGFGLVVVEDGVRGVGVPQGSVEAARSRLAAAGASFVASADLGVA